MLGRYFKFTSSGSDKNEGNHFVEIQIYDENGTNLALGRGVYDKSAEGDGPALSVVTDGEYSDPSKHYWPGTGTHWIVIDLGDIYDIHSIRIWRYYADNRIYKGVFVDVSTDLQEWINVFSTEKNGSYPETAEGYEIVLEMVVLKKYLLRSNSTIYTVTDGALAALAETEITASLFQTYGVDDLPDGALLVGLTDPEVLYWHDSTDELPTLSLTVKGTPPLPQVFTSEPMDLTHESIAGIDHAAVDASADVRFAISFDGGTVWKAHDGSSWFDVSDTAPGMLASTMNAITAEQWAEVVVLDSYMLRFWLPNVTAYVASVVVYYINP